MIHHNVTQGTPEWLKVRMGIPTSSSFDEIITPKTLEVSSQSRGYMHRLIAERLMGHPCEEHVSWWMRRGSQAEQEAVSYYEFQSGTTTTVCGFCTNDEGTIGASPDRFVGEDGLLEIKCPSEGVHVGYLLLGTHGDKYRAQTQGQLWVTGRKWVDVMSYHPDMPPALARFERDEEYIEKLARAVGSFVEQLATACEKLRASGVEFKS